MLQYKNHRFYYEGVSFALPDGYYLDTNYGDGAEDALDFWAKDMSLRIRIAIERDQRPIGGNICSYSWFRRLRGPRRAE